MTKIVGTLHKDVFKFMIISNGILLRIKNFFKYRRKNQKTSKFFFLQNSCHSGDTWKNMVMAEGATDDNIPYILESNPHLNLIRIRFCRFLNRN